MINDYVVNESLVFHLWIPVSKISVLVCCVTVDLFVWVVYAVDACTNKDGTNTFFYLTTHSTQFNTVIWRQI